MAATERDKEILEVILREYSFQWEYFERLDGKLSNCIFIASAIATIYLGLGSTSLEMVPPTNQYYWPIVATLLLGITLFVLTTAISLWGYRPMKYENYPNDPVQFINKHKTSKQTRIVQEEGATIAGTIVLNRNNNQSKARFLRKAFWALGLGTSTIFFFALFMVLALGAS